GNVGINTTTPNAKLTALSSNNTEDAITGNHTSGSTTTAYHGVKGNVKNVAYTEATGYLGYHNTANTTYSIYGIGGNYAGVLLNKTYIGNIQPSIAINTADLEVSNVTAGTAAANLTLRQSTALTVASSDMGYLNFGDNTLAAAQASIRASRDLAGGAGDLPTRLTFHTTPDASTTLTERMRITENGNVGINHSNPAYKLTVVNTDPSIAITTLSTMNPVISAANPSNFHAGWNEVILNQTNNFTGTQYGAVNRVTISPAQTGTINGVIGSTNDMSHSGTNTITTAQGSATYINNLSTGTITNGYAGIFEVANSGGGTITNGYGVRISTIQASNKWSVYASDATAPSYFAGAVGIGNAVPTRNLDVVGQGI
ncbi:MAG: hypothetical protein ABL856_01740, partial [Gallionella sp.]